MSGHSYKINLVWTGNKGSGTSSYRAYNRDYNLEIDGKPTLQGSSDPGFLGDARKHNPEDLFLASIASCHMLWYLHLASTAGIIVTDYQDRAEGKMAINPDGSGEFVSITLRPQVTITDGSMTALAEKIHGDVGQMCFIARSIKTPINHHTTVLIVG